MSDEYMMLAADIVSAYIANNSLPSTELPSLIASVHSSLAGLRDGISVTDDTPDKATPAQIRKSITPEHLISFEDGKPYKTLRRHLTLRSLSPEAYREKWGLPGDYPMTSAGYSAQRSALAKSLGLGQQRRKSMSIPQTEPAPTKAVGRPRGRKKVADTAPTG